MHKYVFLIILVLLLTGLNAEKTNFMKNPQEFYKIMEESELIYKFEKLKEPVKSSYNNLTSPEIYLNIQDSKIYLNEFSITDEVSEILADADFEFSSGNYKQAAKLYKKSVEIDSTYYKAFTYIGNCYYYLKDFKTAKEYFKKSIEKNFVDYQAHWFLADCYIEKKQYKKALEEVTIAHLLNPNHKNIKNIFIDLREITGNKWKDWKIVPQTNVYKNDKNEVIIESSSNWMIYAAIEAVYLFEPGFAKKMTGNEYKKEYPVFEKELSSLIWVQDKDLQNKIEKAAKEDFLETMVYYEILIKKAPTIIPLMSKSEIFDKMKNYLLEYH